MKRNTCATKFEQQLELASKKNLKLVNMPIFFDMFAQTFSCSKGYGGSSKVEERRENVEEGKSGRTQLLRVWTNEHKMPIF